jgi:hypothetical protein
MINIVTYDRRNEMLNLKMILLAVIVVLAVAMPGYCAAPLSFYSSARPMGMGGAFTWG